VRSFFEVGEFWYLGISLCVVVLATVFYKNKAAMLAAFLLLFFLCGIWLTDRALVKASETKYDGQNISSDVRIIKQPQAKQFKQDAVVEFVGHEEFGNVLARMDLYPEYKYGDVLSISCILKTPSNEGLDFDYRMYLAKDKIRYVCDVKNVTRREGESARGFFGLLIGLKNTLERSVSQNIPSPEAALGGGVVFGGSAGLSKEIKNDFSRTGMTHIVAVSGYNVTIIAEYFLLVGIFLGLWRKQAIWFALIGIAIFVAMIGMPSSAVRAAVMGSVLLWAMKHGRIANSKNAIVFAGGVMLALNPLLLRWDIGFQLSFLATIGIVILSPLWESRWIKKNKVLGITEMILLTLSAQIFVLPIIAYDFKTFSVLSLLANIAVLPLVPLVMLLVFCTAVFGAIYAPLALPFAWISYVFLHYIIWIIGAISEIPWAAKEVSINVWGVVVYYVIISGLLYIISRRRRKKITQDKETKDVVF
jgi:competence protein ComEC